MTIVSCLLAGLTALAALNLYRTHRANLNHQRHAQKPASANTIWHITLTSDSTSNFNGTITITGVSSTTYIGNTYHTLEWEES